MLSKLLCKTSQRSKTFKCQLMGKGWKESYGILESRCRYSQHCSFSAQKDWNVPSSELAGSFLANCLWKWKLHACELGFCAHPSQSCCLITGNNRHVTVPWSLFQGTTGTRESSDTIQDKKELVCCFHVFLNPDNKFILFCQIFVEMNKAEKLFAKMPFLFHQ